MPLTGELMGHLDKPRGGVKDFWNTLKSISIHDIAKEANRPISVALVGNAELRKEARKALFIMPGNEAEEETARPEPAFLQEFDSTTKASKFPQDPSLFDIVIDVGGGRADPPEGARIYSIAELGGWERTLDRILQDRPELGLALARNFPVFRRRVADGIITNTATVNAQFSLVTGISAAFPMLGFLLPVNGLSDILMLTKNQAMMTLRLAAAYGLEVDYKSRMKELGPIIANAFGWRAIARELVGAVPFVGFVARAGIAYAGTVTVGKAATLYYETGENISKDQLKKWYQEALESSKGKIQGLVDAAKRRKKDTPALPANSEQSADVIDTELHDIDSDARPILPKEPAGKISA